MSNTSSQTASDSLALWHLAADAVTRVNQRLDAELTARSGLSLAEYRVLSDLSTEGSTLPLNEIAARAHLSKAGLTKLLNRLELRGLVKRTPAPDDGRALRAAPTAKGLRAIESAARVERPVVESLFGAHVSETGHRTLTQAMQAVLKHIVEE